ncbi:hypothetical protein G7046_g9810 [Stylonectria norvegica]|nr:hypothetical protein G7046_g9810 [Stylonectria norvegica]
MLFPAAGHVTQHGRWQIDGGIRQFQLQRMSSNWMPSQIPPLGLARGAQQQPERDGMELNGQRPFDFLLTSHVNKANQMRLMDSVSKSGSHPSRSRRHGDGGQPRAICVHGRNNRDTTSTSEAATTSSPVIIIITTKKGPGNASYSVPSLRHAGSLRRTASHPLAVFGSPSHQPPWGRCKAPMLCSASSL